LRCTARTIGAAGDRYKCRLAMFSIDDGYAFAGSGNVSDMNERPILDRIDGLVEEEHRLWADSERRRLDEAGHERLDAIRAELDRCWDLLRRRRANPDAPERPVRVPDPPNDLDGPEPEPPHLEHGLHGDGPAPDPGEPRNIP
jgi:Protein of unknown function (DUF2630)